MEKRRSLLRIQSFALCLTSLLTSSISVAHTRTVGQEGIASTISTLPAANTTPVPVAQPPTISSEPHGFWDRTHLTLSSGASLARAADYASTRSMQARGREEVLLPDDVVNNSAGFAALESAGTAASVGLSYWMHRTGHHKLERWISIVHIGVTGFGVARNYSLPTNRAGR